MANAAVLWFALFSILPITSADVSSIHHRKQPQVKKGLRNGGSVSSSTLKKSMKEAVDEVLGSGHGIDQKSMEAIRRDLQPMWQSLPQNRHGRVDRRSLRYVAQRYFLRRHGLSIFGLEATHANSTDSEAAMLANYAPNYVRNVLEGAGAQRGFFVEDGVAMVAAILRLIVHSGGMLLEGVYKALGKDSRSDLGRKAIGDVMEAFMLRWMLGDDTESIALLEGNASLKESSFEDWSNMAQFVQGRVTGFEYQRLHPQGRSSGSWNALRPHFSFVEAEEIVGSVTLSFGSYWELECANTKENLMKMDRSHTGRVKLADFHQAALNGEWRFSESKEYLRQLGALDESSSWEGPRVIIANYLQAPSNCIVTSEQHYRVCCANECEQHFSELESAIRAPLATPEQILAVMEPLSSGFDEVEPRLTPALKKQLGEIARTNAGQVPIHGRLFAQWLHYVFPLECPFPQKSGTTSTLSPLAYGDAYMASEQEMASSAAHIEAKGRESEDADEEWMSQWSHDEELLADGLPAPWEADFSTSVLGLMLMAGVGLLLVKSGIISSRSSKDVLPTMQGMKSHYV